MLFVFLIVISKKKKSLENSHCKGSGWWFRKKSEGQPSAEQSQTVSELSSVWTDCGADESSTTKSGGRPHWIVSFFWLMSSRLWRSRQLELQLDRLGKQLGTSADRTKGLGFYFCVLIACRI